MRFPIWGFKQEEMLKMELCGDSAFFLRSILEIFDLQYKNIKSLHLNNDEDIYWLFDESTIKEYVPILDYRKGNQAYKKYLFELSGEKYNLKHKAKKIKNFPIKYKYHDKKLAICFDMNVIREMEFEE